MNVFLKKIALLVGVYIDSVKGRTEELLESFRCNLANDEIDEVHAFIEDEEVSTSFDELIRHPKVLVVRRGRRTLFSEYFEYANQNLSGKVAVIANSDIHFDGTIGLLRKIGLEGILVCLAKYEGNPPILWDPYSSQDAWGFIPPVNIPNLDFTTGCPGSDNALAYAARNSGMQVINPCLSINAYHLDDRSRDRRSGYGPAVIRFHENVSPSKIVDG